MESEVDLFSGESLKPVHVAPVEPPHVVTVPLPELVAVEEAVQQEPIVPSSSIGAQLFGTDLFGESCAPAAGGALKQKFLVPPFSVLNAREGAWQERKRAWIALGLKGEVGRGGNGIIGGAPLEAVRLGPDGKTVRSGECFGSPNKGQQEHSKQKKQGVLHSGPIVDSKNGDVWEGGRSCWQNVNTSVFDPCLAELMFRWFCPAEGMVLDPFGGEATKGIVATVLGYRYTAVEVRQEQVDANNQQAKQIGVEPNWIVGDSLKAETLLPKDLKADLIFTSPPYFDLEIYSDDIADGSAFADYAKFMVWYKDIFRQFVARLKTNRFLVVKVGEIRDGDGIYRNFVGDNIACFKELGLKYYNEIILVTSAGSLPIRAGKQFASGRKIGKTHQNLLVFVKGDPKKAAGACPITIE